MLENAAKCLEEKTGTFGIESNVAGLYYFIDEDRKGVAIAGTAGIVGMTIKQAKAVCRELPGILEVMGYCVSMD